VDFHCGHSLDGIVPLDCRHNGSLLGQGKLGTTVAFNVHSIGNGNDIRGIDAD
jgi:hypothetical protein